MTDVTYEVRDRVMHVLLDGEDTLNSLTPTTVEQLDAMIDAAEADHSLRAVVIRGAGRKAFCVGMDITFLESCFGDPDGVFVPFITSYHATLKRLEALGIPVIAQVDGLARAGGFELILACDIVIAADDAKVGDVHVSFGVPSGGGASARAAHKLGDQRAKALMLTPTWLNGPQMVEWGLAIASHPYEELDAAVASFVGSMVGQSRPAMAITKRLINGVRTYGVDGALDHEITLFTQFAHDPNAGEGFRAFVEKRDPYWGDADVDSYR
ncbi:enoyl-CoA hydratase/isomerase family protein [Aeromicrobium sp. Leaf350]|uniref:enoyl-CoA hydratase/isomerase family protein n=1 Tax=Aeromicrobium sp. Leaf350 TaxID=2876565 RepID=UPI001E30BA86|nr:enoyl-CoA hydratase-related protein [Aeromicrobium sp. Leaf350]